MLGLPLELSIIVGIAAVTAIFYFGKRISFPSGVSLPSNNTSKYMLIGAVLLVVLLFAGTLDRWLVTLTGFPVLGKLFESYGWIGFLIVLVGWGLSEGKLMGIGALLMLFALFFSGLGDYTRSTAERISTTLSCEADPNQAKCVELAQKRAQEAAREQAAKLLEAQRQAALQAAIEAAREAAREAAKPVLQAVRGEPCSTERGPYKDLTSESDCRVVVFGKNEKFYFEGKKDFCPRANPSSAGTWKHLGGDQYDFIPHTNGAKVVFLLLPKGVTLLGSTCT